MNTIARRIQGKIRSWSRRNDNDQQRWDRRWANRAQPMRWETETIPHVLIRALEDGFFPAGASVLDVGCGAGAFAAWLADQGHPAAGCDFSAEAIAHATERHHQDGLRFWVADASLLWEEPEQFDCVFDRGCLHCLPESATATYAANVASTLTPGGRFLLLHKLERTRDELYPSGYVRDRVSAAFKEAFVMEQIEEIDIMDGVVGKATNAIPALAFWMTRR